MMKRWTAYAAVLATALLAGCEAQVMRRRSPWGFPMTPLSPLGWS
jgi:hypothetical protein